MKREFGDSFSNDDLIDISELTSANKNLPPGIEIVQRESKSFVDKFVFQPYVDKDGNHRRYPVPMRWHITPIVQNILNHNKTMQYTGMVLIGMCLVKGSKVMMKSGEFVNIEDLGTYHNEIIDEHIQVPRLLIGKNESNIEHVTKFFKYENQKTIEVITNGGDSVRGTYNHPLLINGKWVELQHMKIGDVLESITPDSIKYKIVKIIHHDEPVTVYDVHVPKTHAFITNGGIISHNSGTGKTTLTRTILHRMHEMGENYRVLWFTGTDMLNIDKIINSCQVGVPHVFVFDDASYTMEDAKKEDVARLANALTTIRHHLKSRAIIIMNIHYSKATKKFFRNQHFTFLTSVTAEEMGNYSDLFKEKMGVVRKFAKYYNQAALKGGFYIPVSSSTYEQLYYKTNEPFRLGLVAEISDLHFFLFDRQECETCNPMTFKKIKDYSALKTDLVTKYGASKVRSVLQFFAMIYDNKTDGDNKKKIQYLNPDYIAIWKNFADINRNIYVPWGKMLEELRGDISEKKKLHHKPGGVKKFRDRSVISVMEQYKKEMEDEKNSKEPGAEFMGPPSDAPIHDVDVDPANYDSTFVGSKTTRFKE